MKTMARWCRAGAWSLFLGFVVGCGSEPTAPAPSVTAPDSDGVQTVAAPAAAVPADASAVPSPTPPDMPESASAAAGDSTSTGEDTPPTAPTMDQWRAWATALAGSDVLAREAASERLDRAVAADPRPLWALLDDASPEVRRGAIFYWLDRFDPADADAVAALSQRLTDPDPAVRAIAISAARRFPPTALVQALPQLNLVLADHQGTAETRAAAARLIGTLEELGGQAVSTLTQAAGGDPDPSVRSACLLALGRVAEVKQAVAVLQEALRQDPHPNVRGLAATRLARLGPAAAEAASALAAALADSDEGVGRKAADTLVELGPAAVPPTVAQLDASEAATRRLAVFVLARLGASAKPAIEAVRGRLQDPDAEVRQLAEAAIRRIEAAQR